MAGRSALDLTTDIADELFQNNHKLFCKYNTQIISLNIYNVKCQIVIVSILKVLGAETVVQIYKETQHIEAKGGIPIEVKTFVL